jgi:hypothetical protein
MKQNIKIISITLLVAGLLGYIGALVPRIKECLTKTV